MNLEQQLEIIIKDAPKYGIPSVIMQQGVIPILRSFAEQLQEAEYYILQTSQQELLLNTLTNIAQPNLEKKVIYAFATLTDAMNFSQKSEQKVYPKPIFLGELLFQLFALKPADSLIFIEQSNRQIEISREKLQDLVAINLKTIFKQTNNQIPPNFA
jgi:hypothetical protein